MKIKKISTYVLVCVLSLFQMANVSADGIFNAANVDSSQPESVTALKESSQRVSDIVTTKIVDSNHKSSVNSDQYNTDDSQTSDAIGEILLQAMSLMGISYKWGGNTPETGMDCSGFIRYVFKKSMGINLPRTVAEMAKVGIQVSADQMQPGDLIFFNTLGGRRNSHIGMYIGDNKFIQSPHTGARIQITYYSGYWISHTNGIKRIVQEQDDQGDVQTFEEVRNEALPSGYIKGKRVKKTHHGLHHHTTINKSKAIQARHGKATSKSLKKVRFAKPSKKKHKG